MNRLSPNERAKVLELLCEEMSIRAVSRVTGVNKNTVIKLLNDAGRALGSYQDTVFRNLSCKRVQVDEIWSFTYCKQRTVGAAKAAPVEAGDAWTWTAICADTKLVFSVLVGDRDAYYANAFMDDVASRLNSRVQLTSDGHKSYLRAVEGLTMRIHMRRFTRLTNAFSKKLENHANAIALHFAYYNFVRVHRTLRMTPAMAASVTHRLREMSDLVAIVAAADAKPNRPRTYHKKAA